TGLIPDPTVDFDGQSSTGTLKFTPIADQFGTATITVTVEDGGLDDDLGTPDDNGVINRTVTVITEAVNDEPTLDALNDININEDDDEQTVNLTGVTAGGGETQVLSITATSDNTGLIPDPTVIFDGQSSTGTLKFTPVADQFGTATITVTVEDGGLDDDLGTPDDNGSILRTVVVKAEAVNDEPTLDALSDININEDDDEQTVNLTGITAGGGETQVLSITATSDNTGLIPDPTVDFDGQSSTGTLKFTPIADQFGTATITVTVEDGGLDDDLGTPEDNGSILRTVVVKVEAVNDEPTLDPVSDLVLPEDSLTQVLDITGITAGGNENQPLQVTALSSNPSLVLHPTVTSRPALGSDTSLLTVTPLPDQYGIATITVTVEDGGLDLDLDTAEDNATFSQTFDVTITPDTDNPPSPVTPHGKMFIHQTLSGDSLVSYQLPAVNVNGEAINGLFNRITATSSDTALIPDPTVLYASADVPSSLSFTPVADANGSAMLSIQVEDGGPDNDFATTEDNRQATHQVEVNVLEVISNQGSATLAKDGSENLYANTQPVTYQEQQAQTNIAGFAAIGATSENGENALLVQRSSVTNRLVTDDAWRINGLFDSLQNESSTVLDLTAREVSSTLNVAAVSGAYEVNGVNNPTLIVRRGQTYTFNLNAAGHPFYLQTTGSGYQSADAYSGGFTGNGQTSGEHQWVVPEDAPDEIYYQCEFHPVMFGKIIVID
ncbi:MAG: cupredoxin domain-containing protein, partial [Pirellulales bacterium]